MSNAPKSITHEGETYIRVSALSDILTRVAESFERDVRTPAYGFEQGTRDRVRNGVLRAKASVLRMVRDEIEKGMRI